MTFSMNQIQMSSVSFFYALKKIVQCNIYNIRRQYLTVGKIVAHICNKFLKLQTTIGTEFLDLSV